MKSGGVTCSQHWQPTLACLRVQLSQLKCGYGVKKWCQIEVKGVKEGVVIVVIVVKGISGSRGAQIYHNN